MLAYSKHGAAICGVGAEPTDEQLTAQGGRLVPSADASWLYEKPRDPQAHLDELTIVAPIAAGYPDGIVNLVRYALDHAFPGAVGWWPLASHRFDFELRAPFDDQVRDELLRTLAARFGARRCTVDGEPLRVPARAFSFSNPLFLHDAWRSAALLGFGIFVLARHGTRPFYALLVLSFATLAGAVRAALFAPRHASIPKPPADIA